MLCFVPNVIVETLPGAPPNPPPPVTPCSVKSRLFKAKEKLNYNPQFTLQQGLKEAVKWYWENL